jgi:hypothetical protein
VATFVILNWAVASWVIWQRYTTWVDGVAVARWPMQSGVLEIEAKKTSAKEDEKGYRALLVRNSAGTSLELSMPGKGVYPLVCWSEGTSLHLASISKGSHFYTPEADISEIGASLQELGAALPHPGLVGKIMAAFVIRPLVTGVRIVDGELSWRISSAVGTMWTGGAAGVREADIRFAGWQGHLVWQDEASASAGKPDPLPPGLEVPASEWVLGVAESIRMLTFQITPVAVEADELRRSGRGWLEVRNGHRQMLVEGTPYEMGFQHGSLAPENIRRAANRLVYGVGLLYSLERGQWFPQAARELVERQRPFIAPAYFEEMKGLAEGAGLPLDLVQATNIFPEFFHCSGAALMGNATVGGELLHARVLDYMTEVGLQEEAVVMAVAGTGVNRFVTVGYLGFIGSVTGMNDKQVAIGEMGGKGEGDWDGVPMSLLIRQSLETCDTLADVERLMRESPRTCEYYYLITDGKGPSALGIAATPTKFETFGPGDWNEQLNQPVDDAVLLSGKGRYEELVKRVRDGYGKIDRDGLIEIIKRPVAMRSNLHNVIFQPQSLRLSVADATRGGAACDQPYRTYTWSELFSGQPPVEGIIPGSSAMVRP